MCSALYFERIDGCAAVLVMSVAAMSQLTQHAFYSMLKNVLHNTNVANLIKTESRVFYVFTSTSQCRTLYVLCTYFFLFLISINSFFFLTFYRFTVLTPTASFLSSFPAPAEVKFHMNTCDNTETIYLLPLIYCALWITLAFIFLDFVLTLLI